MLHIASKNLQARISAGRTAAGSVPAMRHDLPLGLAGDPTVQWARNWLKCLYKIVASVSETGVRGIWIANVIGTERALSHAPTHICSDAW